MLGAVSAPTLLQRHRSLRWLAPVGVLCVAGLAATGVLKARASSPATLPTTTPAALVTAVQQAKISGFSGTVVSQLSLGLPELPNVPGVGDATSFAALLSGSHTLEVWFGGLDKQRIALIGATDEVDLFRDGPEVWQWSSEDRTALHYRLPARPASAPRYGAALPIPTSAPSFTPVALGKRLLHALDPSTVVTLDDEQTVAGRSAYDLVLTPRSARTKVGSVHIAVDGQTKVPLGVQIYARGTQSPAVDIAFTSVRFAPQPDRNFTFSPPEDATVRQLARPSPSVPAAAQADGVATARRPKVSGSDWSSVLELPASSSLSVQFGQSAMLRKLAPVSGRWGSGRLLDSSLLSVLVTNDGRVFAGAVDPSDLYAAAGTK